MAVSYKMKGKPVKVAPDPDHPIRDDADRLQQLEVFGRLNMSHKLMAQYFGITNVMMSNLMRRTDYQRAYERGRAEATIAVRQKQLQLALGGNVTLLLHAGVHFADQDKESPKTSDTAEAANHDHSWEADLVRRAQAVKDTILASQKA